MYTFLYRTVEYLDKDAPASPIYKRSLYPGKVGEVKQTTYHFVDLIRFISTIGIAFMHTDIPFAGHSLML